MAATKYYGTFGVGTPLGYYYVAFWAVSELAARAWMAENFPKHWCGIYGQADYADAIERFPLTQLIMPLSVQPSEEAPVGWHEAE